MSFIKHISYNVTKYFTIIFIMIDSEIHHIRAAPEYVTQLLQCVLYTYST